MRQVERGNDRFNEFFFNYTFEFYNLHLIKYKRRFFFSFFVLIFVGHESHALSLLEAYESALANDSVYRSAKHENDAGQQYKVLGRSGLLPSISASYNYNKNKSDLTGSSYGAAYDEKRDYNSKNGMLSLQQPIISMEKIARYRQGNLKTKLSDKNFLASKQELIQRFFGFYAQVNYAEQDLKLSIAERDSFLAQVEANKLMLARGESTKTALLESQARLNLSEAQLIESKNVVERSRYELAAMIGKDVENLDQLSDSFEIKPLFPVSIEAWETIALANNLEISAQKESVSIAYQEIKRNRAAHAPTLDFVASISKSKSDTTATYNQREDKKIIGLQFSLPIYSGGSTDALTAQAVSNYLKEQDNHQTKTNEVLLNLREQYNTVLSSSLKIAALKQLVESADMLIMATEKSMVGGVRTSLDVLAARKQLFEAKRDFSAASYKYLVAYINLKKAAGTLTIMDLEEMSINFERKK